MKREVKPFVVEVKRGKRRQSFLGQPDDDTAMMSEATRRAELALFSGPNADAAQAKASVGEPAGRILPSLIEPPPAEAEPDDPQPRRRGRKPGSKNKPKVPVPGLSDAPPPVAVAPALPGPRYGVSPAAADVFDAPAEAPPAEVRHEPSTREPRRQRLRDRSRILARYVHGTAPVPGEAWMRRGRRMWRSNNSKPSA